MTVSTPAGWPTPASGWPRELWEVPYVAGQHPGAAALGPLRQGANCQRFAYEVLRLFGIEMPPHRSSDLWDDPRFPHPDVANIRALDLVLFNADRQSWGAHVAVYMDDGQLLHLSAEVGVPAVWGWDDFGDRSRYRSVVGVVRPVRW